MSYSTILTYTATMNAVPLAAAPAYAGFWRRFLAYFIDSVILTVVLTTVFALFDRAGGPTWEERAPFAGITLTFVIWWLYGAAFESSAWQGTLGKLALGIIVTDTQGQRLSFGRALARNVAKIVTNLTLLIGYVIAAFTPRKQALHDLITDCVLLKRRVV